MDELFQYQKAGAHWLASCQTALLADEMGLGKSAQSIAACDLALCSRVLVLCPASARVNWHREFQRFSTIRRDFCIITKKNQEPEATQSVICSYDLASQLVGEEFDVLILDEVHYLKSPTAKRTHFVFGKTGLIRYANKVWALSGTPMPNHIGEMWVLLYSFGATALSYNQWVERYCTFYDGPHGRQITGTQTIKTAEIRKIIEPGMLRRKKEDVLKELPPIHFTHMIVEPGPVDMELQDCFAKWYFPENREDELMAKIEEEKKVAQTLTEAFDFTNNSVGRDTMRMLEALAKSVSTLRRYSALQKLEPVAAMIEEELMFGAYEKVVIFAIHKDVIEGLRVRLRKFGAVTLYGNTDPKTRVKNIDKFQNNPRIRVFIGNIQAAGVAITLTAAHQVVFLEQSWTPGDNAQAAMRCHRIGQTHPVFVRFVGLADSIDEKVSQVLKIKARQITRLFDPESHEAVSLHGLTRID